MYALINGSLKSLGREASIIPRVNGAAILTSGSGDYSRISTLFSSSSTFLRSCSITSSDPPGVALCMVDRRIAGPPDLPTLSECWDCPPPLAQFLSGLLVDDSPSCGPSLSRAGTRAPNCSKTDLESASRSSDPPGYPPLGRLCGARPLHYHAV